MGNKREDDFSHICKTCQEKLCCFDSKPPTTDTRRKLIENHLIQNGICIKNAFSQTGYVFPKVSTTGYCLFLDKKTERCKVHPVKPETCVAGPITFDINIETGKIEWHLKTEKICPLAGALYRNKAALERHLKSAKREILVLVRELDADALKAILKIDEPETFKIGEDSIGQNVLGKLS